MKRTIAMIAIILILLSSGVSCFPLEEKNIILGIDVCLSNNNDINSNSTFGFISGYVTDIFNNPLIGVRVRVDFHSNYREEYTDRFGYYNVTPIPICYCLKDVTVEKEGYYTISLTRSIQYTKQNFTLTPKHIFYVDDDEGADYTSIQDAIDNASDGGTVYVHSGIYQENIIIDKSIILQGESNENTIIDGQDVTDCITIYQSNVTIQNFKLINSSIRFENAGIKIRKDIDNVHISNCVIQDNHYGIQASNSNNITIYNCKIQQNNDRSIYLQTTSNITIYKCNISYNGNADEYNEGGIIIQNSDQYHYQSHIKIQQCHIFENSYDGISIRNNGRYSLGCTDIIIEKNMIFNNKDSGIDVKIWENYNNSGYEVFTQNNHLKILDCTIQGNNRGINIAHTNNVTIHNCSIKENHAESIHIFTSSDMTIQHCDIINNGAYFDLSSGDFRISNTPYYDTQSNITIHHCNIINNAYHGISIGNGGEEKIGYSNVTIHHNMIKDNTDNGILIWTSEVDIHNNTFIGNGIGDSHDGGIMCQDVIGTVHIYQNVFHDNADYGIFFLRSHNNIVRNNNFFENTIHIGFIDEDTYNSKNELIENYYDDTNNPWFKIHHGFFVLRIGISPFLFILPFQKFIVEWYPLLEPIEIMN